MHDATAVFDVSLGLNGFMYRVDFINMSQTNVSAGGSRQRRLCRGSPPLDLERYIAWDSLKETPSIAHPSQGIENVSCLTPFPFL